MLLKMAPKNHNSMHYSSGANFRNAILVELVWNSHHLDRHTRVTDTLVSHFPLRLVWSSCAIGTRIEPLMKIYKTPHFVLKCLSHTFTLVCIRGLEMFKAFILVQIWASCLMHRGERIRTARLWRTARLKWYSKHQDFILLYSFGSKDSNAESFSFLLGSSSQQTL